MTPLPPPPADAPHTGWAEYYLSLGWVLTHFAPGTKGPSTPGWNTREQWIDTPTKAFRTWSAHPDHGLGLIHAPSGTVALDVDDVEASTRVFAEFGLDLAQLVSSGLRIAGKAGRAKALFAVKPDAPLSFHKVQWKTAAGARALFELRAGAVHDCLPPSLHPAGHRYAWLVTPWELAEIPLVPDDLLHFWIEFPAIRDQIAAMAPGAESVALPPALPFSGPAEGHNDIIGAYNRSHTVHELLARHGYVRKGKHRYLAPSSTTKTPGVSVLSDGRVYSHHGSDVLADGHAHDAFDLYRIFEHNGNLKSAVSDAALSLGMSVYGDASLPRVDVDLQALTGNGNGQHRPIALMAVGAEEHPDIPAELLTPPGILAEIAQYGLDTSVRPVPIFAVQAALALGSVVCARRYVTSQRNYSSLYFLNVAKSGTGKEEAKTTIEAILTAAGVRRLIGGSSFSSGGAVYSALLQKPQHIAILDEFGKYLSAASLERESFRSDALTRIIEAFGRLHADMSTPQFSTMTVSTKHKAEMEPKIIQRPALTIVALTTPEIFYEALTSTRVLDGFLNRFLVAEHTGARQAMREWQEIEIPLSIVQWVQLLTAPRAGIQDGLDDLFRLDHLPAPTFVPLSEGSRRRSLAFEREMLALADQLEAEGMGAMAIRAHEIGLRLGLVCAMADTPDTPAVTDDVLDWSFKYVRYFLDQTIRALQARLSDTPTMRYRKQVYAAVVAAGVVGVTERELHRTPAFVSIPRRDRVDAIDSLVKAELVAWMQVPTKGRTRMALVAVTDAFDTSDNICHEEKAS